MTQGIHETTLGWHRHPGRQGSGHWSCPGERRINIKGFRGKAGEDRVFQRWVVLIEAELCTRMTTVNKRSLFFPAPFRGYFIRSCKFLASRVLSGNF